MTLLESIHSTTDVKKIPANELSVLAKEIRARLVSVVEKNGGHLASNLGVVELTIALHRVFDSPIDKIVFDVSHQTYVHKLLTGRNGKMFDNIRQTGGYCGFSCPNESEHDHFIAGHAGTALSVALGLAYSRDKKNKNYDVIAVLGDATLSCGMTMEALNCLSETTTKIIIIVNDNSFSIDKNVGAIPRYVNHIITSKLYKITTTAIKSILGHGKFAKYVIEHVRALKRAIKSMILPSSYFEYYGMRYLGPVDGHDIRQLEETFEFCKHSDRPVIVHVKTTKGKGLPEAMVSPDKFHSLEPNTKQFSTTATNNRQILTYSDILGRELVNIAKNDDRVVCVTAAMAKGTGLWHIRDEMPDRYIDVGIAEEHAVTFCGALTKDGMRPVCAIYSTFLQRAYDQISHDICSQNLNVVFCVARAEVSPNDGMTHHGIFDISYLRHIPNAVIYQPWGEHDFKKVLHAALTWDSPVFIRYPKVVTDVIPIHRENGDIAIGRSSTVLCGSDIRIISFGSMQEIIHALIEKFYEVGIHPSLVSANFIKPLDGDMLLSAANNNKLIITIEDNVLAGGFGSAVLEFYNDNGIQANVLRVGWPDAFVGHATSKNELMEKHGISAEKIFKMAMNRLSMTNR